MFREVEMLQLQERQQGAVLAQQLVLILELRS
jgi:hypothetical protein